ncbi:AsmA-like C-terminal region-containing protein [Candidatus Pelagibacter bacterium]|nr:AsmA-like C-terminal region-containing protein [Candidatus Pelagibacter bacterium]
MKKNIINLVLLSILLFISLLVALSTVGIETNKFNRLISQKVSQTKNIYLNLETIKFKINPKKLSLFLETQNPEITYRDTFVPVRNIKVYIDFLSLLKSSPEIKKISLILEEIDVSQLNKLSTIIKPSNLKSLLNNKIKKGKLISEIEIFLTKQGDIKDFIARGNIKELKAQLFSNLMLTKVSLNFFADKNDILIKNVFGNIEDIKISDGDIKLNLENGIKLNSNFNSKLNFDEKLVKKYTKFFSKYEFANNVKSLKANFNNYLSIDLDKTYKVKDYNYKISGNIKESKFELLNPLKNSLITEKIKEIYLSDLQITSIFKPKIINLKSEGKYSFNNLDFLKINFENNWKNNLMNLKLNLSYRNSLELGIINYVKPKDSIAKLSLNFEKKINNLKINKLNLEEGKNLILIEDLRFQKNKFSTFKKIKVKTTNNDFFIENGKKIQIKGNKFDATNLAKFFTNRNSENKFQKLNSNIEIDFKNIKVSMTDILKNFKLIGEIEGGQFVKISSKGDFGGNNFLDISMRKDKKTKKKYLEIYSDLTQPLLTEYNFFNGLSGGKLLFTSLIDGSASSSKLKIENFKVINAPGVIKLLSIADLGGLEDLAKGEGISFDELEINMEKKENFLKINEIIALGPSISVLMEGYQDENDLVSLRGTLVPAKTLNKIISKIPVIGNIVIPKEVGEGLFGISFKIKGSKGEMKTTINPLRTLTPRFIQKIIDRNKTTK